MVHRMDEVYECVVGREGVVNVVDDEHVEVEEEVTDLDTSRAKSLSRI